MLEYNVIIEAKALTQLSNESAIEWLKVNAAKKKSSLSNACDNEELKNIANFRYYKRNETSLLLAFLHGWNPR
jgi:hypothetical protein